MWASIDDHLIEAGREHVASYYMIDEVYHIKDAAENHIGGLSRKASRGVVAAGQFVRWKAAILASQRLAAGLQRAASGGERGKSL